MSKMYIFSQPGNILMERSFRRMSRLRYLTFAQEAKVSSTTDFATTENLQMRDPVGRRVNQSAKSKGLRAPT